MGNDIDWTALEVLIPLFGIEDPQDFISQLVAVRDHVRLQSKGQ